MKNKISSTVFRATRFTRGNLFFFWPSATVALVAATLVSAIYFLIATRHEVAMLLRRLFSSQNIPCACDHLFSFANHPFLNSTLFLATALAAYLLMGFTINLFLLWYRTAKQVKVWSVVERRQVVHHQCVYKMLVVAAPENFIFTHGWWRPTIIVSQALVSTLSAAELHSVIWHEVAHIRHHDIIKKFLTTAFLQTCLFWPSRSRAKIIQFLELCQEARADHFALQHIPRLHLLSAFTKFLATPVNDTIVPAHHIVATLVVNEWRLRHLINATPLQITHIKRGLIYLWLIFALGIGLNLILPREARMEVVSSANRLTSSVACIME